MMMKAGILASGLLLVAIAPSVGAMSNTTCEKVSARSVSSKGKVYKFAGTVKCTLNASNVETNTLMEAVRTFMTNGGSFINETDGFTRNGMSGTQMEYREHTAHTANGDITITYDASLVSNDSQVSFAADSTSIKAKGDTERTEAVQLDFDYTNSNGVIQVTVTKTIDVKKPTFAPSGIFESRVLDLLKKEIQVSAQHQKTMLDAL